MAVRKSISNPSFTSDDRVAFVNALKALKAKDSLLTPRTRSRYDDYVYTHMQAMLMLTVIDQAQPIQNGNWSVGAFHMQMQMHMPMSMPAHQCPAFLPWHREFLRNLELDLQQVSDVSMAIPYWDFSVDSDPGSLPWTDDFMGGDGGDGPVSGPFAHPNDWPITLSATNFGVATPLTLIRGFGLHAGAKRLPNPKEVQATLAVTQYDSLSIGDPPASFRQQLEGLYVPPESRRTTPTQQGVTSGMHQLVHNWVGGTKGTMLGATSPNDPIFFLLHSNIDRLWAIWQESHPGSPNYVPQSPSDYPRQSGQALGLPMIFYDPMKSNAPWKGPMKTPGDVLDHTALGYHYDSYTVAR